jgi:hypothetical protein
VLSALPTIVAAGLTYPSITGLSLSRLENLNFKVKKEVFSVFVVAWMLDVWSGE